MLSIDTMLVQPSNSGSWAGTGGNATLPIGTIAGSTVLLAVTAGAVAVTTPSGFTSDGPPTAGQSRVYLFRRSNVPAGETSWAVTNTSGVVRWTAYEVDGLDPDAPLDVKAPTGGTTNTTSGTSVPTGTTAQTTTFDALEVAVFGSYHSASTTPPTFSGHTNGFVEVDEGTATDGTKSVALSVAMRTTQQLGTESCTATSSQTLNVSAPVINTGSFIVVYSAAGAKRDPNIAHFWAFLPGVSSTPAGLGTGAAGFRYFETVAGSPAITANGLQLASSAAAENVATATIAFQPVPALNSHVIQTRFRFDGSLPSVDTDLVATVGGSNQLLLRYVAASQKLGFKIGAGTEVLSDATVAADAWYTVDLRIISASSTQTGDWQIDYGAGPVTQTQATLGAAATSGQVRLGWAGAITVPGVTFAHLLVSNVAGHYPLGAFIFALVGPDPAGTPTVSGTAANFNTFTANGTLAAWNAPTARDAVDDWPPVFGASADGFAAVTASATDYVEVPLATYNASGVGSIRAARVVVPMWAASATAATCRVLGFDGTTATTLFAEANPTTDNSSTPGWVCKMWRPTGGWTQALLDAAAVRFGSNDATPDIGPHAIGMEVAIQAGDTQPHFGGLVSSVRDPITAGLLAISAAPTRGYDATLHYEEGGTPTDVPTPGGATTTEMIDAPDAPSVNYVALYPPAEDISDA